jgi:hypothetical protein
MTWSTHEMERRIKPDIGQGFDVNNHVPNALLGFYVQYMDSALS